MKKLLFGIIALGSLSSFAQVDVVVKEGVEIKKTFEGQQKAARTNETSGDTFGLDEFYITANDRNAHIFCISKNFDKATSYRKSGSARAEATEINTDGTAKSVKFDIFRDDSVLSDVTCILNR